MSIIQLEGRERCRDRREGEDYQKRTAHIPRAFWKLHCSPQLVITFDSEIQAMWVSGSARLSVKLRVLTLLRVLQHHAPPLSDREQMDYRVHLCKNRGLMWNVTPKAGRGRGGCDGSDYLELLRVLTLRVHSNLIVQGQHGKPITPRKRQVRSGGVV